MTALFKAKPFIIAEIGSNFARFDDAKDAISHSKAAGADAVKFQMYDAAALYGTEYVPEGFVPSIPADWLPKLKEKADACGIEFMCSAFSPEFYDVVDPFVQVHKIASSELTCPKTLEKVKSKGKPILLSVGASSKGDIEQAMQILHGGPRVVLMYCVSGYPSKQFNLFYMQDLAESFNVPMGYSDHSTAVVYPALSAVHHFGAVVIEKHVNFAGINSPDSPHSLSKEEFTLMCEFLRGKRDFKAFNPMPEERSMFLRHNRRLVAIRDIDRGDAFRYGRNFGSFRSLKDDTRGMIPFIFHALEQSAGATRRIKAGDAIGPEDF